jgi:hypothetical protein
VLSTAYGARPMGCGVLTIFSWAVHGHDNRLRFQNVLWLLGMNTGRPG